MVAPSVRSTLVPVRWRMPRRCGAGHARRTSPLPPCRCAAPARASWAPRLCVCVCVCVCGCKPHYRWCELARRRARRRACGARPVRSGMPLHPSCYAPASPACHAWGTHTDRIFPHGMCGGRAAPRAHQSEHRVPQGVRRGGAPCRSRRTSVGSGVWAGGKLCRGGAGGRALCCSQPCHGSVHRHSCCGAPHTLPARPRRRVCVRGGVRVRVCVRARGGGFVRRHVRLVWALRET